ncbi:WD40 repeat, partial [Trinorchestia longiramus]
SCHITLPGHRADTRAVQFSSVGDTIVSLSNDSFKTWHRSDLECQCTGTMVLPSLVRSFILAPGDKYAILGAASGHIFLVELATGTVVEDIAGAHCNDEEAGKSDVTALSLTADSKGLVSGGLDHTVRIWRFELVSDITTGRRLTLESASDCAIKLHDGVTALHCSPDGRLLAVATLDNKETLYYIDTMKLHQELYGKSLPSTCVSFNHPGTLVVTGSKDSAIRLYGTDFGDMRKLIKNAHTGGVTSVKFQAQTNLFFSTGHDGLLNYWDADSFQRIMTLRGHAGIARCLSVAPKGNWVVTCGQDHSLRLWERTQEILNLQEEREEERRRQEEEELGGEELLAGQKRHVEGETRDSEAVRAGRPTAKTEEAVDVILAALRMYQTHLNCPDTAPHYLMLSYGIMDPVECFAEVLARIKSSLLEEAIVQLELSQVLSLLVVLARMCKRNLLTEASVRVAVIAVRTNMPQLTASNTALPFLSILAKHITNYTKTLQDKVGFTTAGLRQCIERHESRHETQLFADAFDRHSTSNKKKKKKEIASRRARLAIS